MYLHVGSNKDIRTKNIVGIFDFDNATLCDLTRKYLAKNQSEGLVETANYELPKSFVLYYSEKDGFYKICFSQLSSAVLCERVNS